MIKEADMPKVSILMGIYNCADTLEEAVESIKNQTFTDWELIMCDDGSKDNTFEVAQKIAQKDHRIKVIINEKNLTLAPTLNRCAKVARGKYLARMDGDDVCDKTRFEKELKVLESNPSYAVVSCQMNLFDEGGIYRVVTYAEHPDVTDFVKQSPFCHAGCMMRKDVFDSIGGYSESLDYKRVEDYDLWTRMYRDGYIGYNIQEPLYSMRDDRNALKRRTLDNRKNEIRVKKNIIKWFNLSKRNYIYILITVAKAITPSFIYKVIHKA